MDKPTEETIESISKYLGKNRNQKISNFIDHLIEENETLKVKNSDLRQQIWNLQNNDKIKEGKIKILSFRTIPRKIRELCNRNQWARSKT